MTATETKPRRRTQKVEQLDLMDVAPENAGEIKALAEEYRDCVSERASWLAKEVELKEKLKQMILEAELPRDNDGKINLRIGGLSITVTPRDEVIQVKEAKPKSDEGE